MRLLGLLAAVAIGLLLYVQYFKGPSSDVEGEKSGSTIDRVNKTVDQLQTDIDVYGKRQQDAFDALEDSMKPEKREENP